MTCVSTQEEADTLMIHLALEVASNGMNARTHTHTRTHAHTTHTPPTAGVQLVGQNSLFRQVNVSASVEFEDCREWVFFDENDVAK